MRPALAAAFGIPTPVWVEAQAEATQVIALGGSLTFEPEAVQQHPQLTLDAGGAMHRVTVNSLGECRPR
jgi:hypothetical protein